MTKQLWIKSKFKVLDKYTGKSKFVFWSNLLPGDIIEVSTRMHSSYYSHVFYVEKLNPGPCPICKDAKRFVEQGQWIECKCEAFVKFNCGATKMQDYLTKVDLQEI